MKLHTLPDILFPNPIQHPNYKLPILMKIKEEIHNNFFNIEPQKISRQQIRSMKRVSIRNLSNITSAHNTGSNFRSGSSKFHIIKEHSLIEEMDESFQRTRTPSQMMRKLRRGTSLFEK